MPISYVKKLAKKHGTSVSKAESRWEAAKRQAAKQGHEGEFAYTMGIFKHMMGEAEVHLPEESLGTRRNKLIRLSKDLKEKGQFSKEEFIKKAKEMFPKMKDDQADFWYHDITGAIPRGRKEEPEKKYVRNVKPDEDEIEESSQLNELAVSQAQRRLMAMAYAYKKGELDLEDIEKAEEIKKIAKSMSLRELKKFAKTEEKRLPKYVKEGIEEKFSKEDIAMARDLIKRARAELGKDLGGGSVVDLLLDNMPQLRGSKEAKELAHVAEKNIKEYISFKDYVILNEEEIEKVKKDPVKASSEEKKKRKTIHDAVLSVADNVSFKKDGTIVAKRGYFYRPAGLSADQFGAGIKAKLQKMGFDVEVVDTEDHWAPWPRDSYYKAILRVKKDRT